MTKTLGHTNYMWEPKQKEETKEAEHSLFDMTDMILQMKIDKLRKGKSLKSIKNITIDSLMLSFCRILGSDIENAKKVRQIIEYRFIKTKILNIFNMVAMLMLIVFPFIFQIFVDQKNTTQIHNSLIVCLSGSVFFMIQELI